MAQGESKELDVSFTADAILATVMPDFYEFQLRTGSFNREQVMISICCLFIEGLRAQIEHVTAAGDER